jgi:hypothetical protein
MRFSTKLDLAEMAGFLLGGPVEWLIGGPDVTS